MRSLIFTLMFLSGCTGATTALKWNYMDDRYQPAQEGDILKYNYYTKKYSYESVKSELRYNYQNNAYEWYGR